MPASTKTVAIVEDDPQTRDIFGMILRHHGYRVAEAEDGLEGLDLIRERHPALVLLDLGLPRLNGWEVARALQDDPDTEDIPILLVTAQADLGGRGQALELGCVDYLTKPLDPTTLVRRVRRCIGGPHEGDPQGIHDPRRGESPGDPGQHDRGRTKPPR